METNTFRALRVRERDGTFTRAVENCRHDELPAGDVVVQVHYSSLNYKDALSASGNRGVTRNYPHTPGIDAAGVVERDDSGTLEPGTEVLVHAHDLGANTWGGYSERIRVPADWVLSLPDGLSMRDAAAYGTAGFTAAQSILELEENGVSPDAGQVLVTGASGGVGSIATAILAKLGFPVVAVTGKEDAADRLREFGAADVISREDAADPSSRPLLKSRWAGVVDTVGGPILATAVRAAAHGGVVTACGNAASGDLPLTVYPFILRGVRLVGIDSAWMPKDRRREIWNRLAGRWSVREALASMLNETDLAGTEEWIGLMLEGGVQGRVIVRVGGS
ncbi:MAG: YhdH/YhfP family quinone oxidoreductase [Spirochaetaceae bacterium]